MKFTLRRQTVQDKAEALASAKRAEIFGKLALLALRRGQYKRRMNKLKGEGQ